jgi:four helix bundle protein
MMKERDEGARAYDLEERLIQFSIRVLDLVEGLPRTRVGNHIAGQLVRCGTSPPANYGEAQSAESRSDFIHKMKVILKELREVRVWLILTQRRGLVKSVEKVATILAECNELIAIFVASVGTASRKRLT